MASNAFASLDSIKKLEVDLAGVHVGTLARTPDGPLAFQYTESWLEDGFSISPFSLPLTEEVFVAKRVPLDGVFGVFNDSLPDGWGRLLVDRMLRQEEIDPLAIGPLARLAIVGSTGMGALEYRPAREFRTGREQRDLDVIAEECASLLETDYSDDLDTLFTLGGSSGGARPKILTAIDGEDWIVKFRSSVDPKDIGEQEFNIAQAAIAYGIEMPEVRLMSSQICSGYFATKRFDRILHADTNSAATMQKLHMASAGALLETSHRIPNLDYDLLLKLTMKLTDSAEEVRRLFQLMVFNVLCGNRDDHAKNFTFIHDADRSWRLSPAYDLTENPGMNGERATTVNGKGKDITVSDVLEVASRIGISKSDATSEIENATTALRTHDCQVVPFGA